MALTAQNSTSIGIFCCLSHKDPTKVKQCHVAALTPALCVVVSFSSSVAEQVHKHLQPPSLAIYCIWKGGKTELNLLPSTIISLE